MSSNEDTEMSTQDETAPPSDEPSSQTQNSEPQTSNDDGSPDDGSPDDGAPDDGTMMSDAPGSDTFYSDAVSMVSEASNRRPPISPGSVSSRRDTMSDAGGPDSPRSELIESEGEGEDLIAGGMERDYRVIPELDRYSDVGIDNTTYNNMDVDAMRAAEEELDRRDARRRRKLGIRDRRPAALRDFDSQRPLRRRRLAERAATGEYDEEEDTGVFVNLEDYNGPLAGWIATDAVGKEVRKRFKRFLINHENEDGNKNYLAEISKMCAANGQSLIINYYHLSQTLPLLAIWLADCPEQMIQLFDETAQEVTNEFYRDYSTIQADIHVRISNLPLKDELRELRQMHLGGLIQCCGVVTRRTSVYPQLKAVKYNCVKCGNLMGPYLQNNDKEITPGSCPSCQSQGPFNLNVEQTIYRNFQKLTLQEPPGSVPAGRIPRSKDVVLTNDLIDIARPGEEITVTGIYSNNFDSSLNTRNGFPVFATVIHANHIEKKEDMFAAYQITDEDKKMIHEYSSKPNVFQIIRDSIAPSIWGHKNIKTALALSLAGGVRKQKSGGKHKLRGDINVLILGDPGTAKSQFLKYVEKTARRAVYATGKGASAVGLTASVHKDPLTREWTLEGGALVLADQGVCLIDEFDKMNDQDRTSIHEAMEQQTISISKAGIIATLQARCSVIAAANPIKGRYDSSATFVENVDLTDPIISRFDVLCVVRDTVDPVEDERLADFVVGNHMKSHPYYEKPEGETGPTEVEKKNQMPQDLLKKYIVYARQRCSPKMDQIDQDKIEKVYAELRKESMREGGIPIGVRHIESLVRMAEARAKLHLREYVNNDDVDMAISVLCDWFVNTQKFSVMRSMRKAFKKYMVESRDNFELLAHVLRELLRESQVIYNFRGEDIPPEIEVDQADFEAKAQQLGISDVTPFYTSNQFKSTFKLDEQRKAIIG